MTVLKATGLRVERGDRTLVDNLDLEVGPGGSIAVTGPSASGKTSLLAVLAGLSQPAAGSVSIDGRPVRSSELGIVLQGYGLVSLLTATENVEVALRAAGRSGTDAQESSFIALERVGLAELVGHLVEELSGGQQQRVAVARALAAAPAILIADEPTAEQDEATRAVVLDQLFSVPEHGGALVLATHDPDVAARCEQQLHIGTGAMPPRASEEPDPGPTAAPPPAEPVHEAEDAEVEDDGYDDRATRHHEWLTRWPRRTGNVYGRADRGPYTCPCCYFRTLPERGGYDVCPVCRWEDDGQDDHDADDVRNGPNGALSLTAARSSFRRIGAVNDEARRQARPPRPEER